MVIYDLDIKGITVFEAKTYTPLVVDSNAPLTFTVTSQSFKSVAWRDMKVFKSICIIKHLQLALGNSGECFESMRTFALEQRQCVLAIEGLDRRGMI